MHYHLSLKAGNGPVTPQEHTYDVKYKIWIMVAQNIVE